MSEKFKAWSPDSGSTEEDAREVRAFSAEQAAEIWAEFEDSYSADYNIVRGTPANVCVRDGEKVRKFIVVGETVAQYRAREET